MKIDWVELENKLTTNANTPTQKRCFKLVYLFLQIQYFATSDKQQEKKLS